MRNKLFQMSFILLVAISLLTTVTFVLYKYVLVPEIMASQAGGDENLSIEEIVEYTVPVEEITTNLADNRLIVIQFSIVCNNEKAKEELEKGKFLVKREILGVLSSVKSEELKGEEGVNALEARIKERINSFLKNGKVIRVVTTNKIIQ